MSFGSDRLPVINLWPHQPHQGPPLVPPASRKESGAEKEEDPATKKARKLQQPAAVLSNPTIIQLQREEEIDDPEYWPKYWGEYGKRYFFHGQKEMDTEVEYQKALSEKQPTVSKTVFFGKFPFPLS